MVVNLQKAYDYVGWRAIEETLIGFCFARDFVGLILDCVTTSRFFIVVEGPPWNLRVKEDSGKVILFHQHSSA